MFHVNWVDGVILVILVLSMLTGLVRGFIKEAVALCVWILAIWFAIHDFSLVANWMKRFVADQTTRYVLTVLLIIIVTVLLGSLINMILGFLLHTAGLTGTDRSLGMVFGFVRGVFIVSLLILVCNMTSLVQTDGYIKQSLLYKQFTPIVNWLSTYTPGLIQHMEAIDVKK